MAALGLCLCAAFPASAEAPARVVSMNLCTDQLALLIAAPGQVVSVSHFAADPAMSTHADLARGLPANRGRAEEISLLAPDLVLADVWSSPATVSMLTRLGVRVERFTPGESMEEVRANILRMGAVLGREARAAEVLAAFDAALAALPPPSADPPRAAIYAPGGYTYGSATLAGQILKAAGFANVAEEAGLPWGGTLSVEDLVMTAPDLVVSGRAQGRSRAEAMLRHPALAELRRAGAATDVDWACATPAVADAAARLADIRLALEAGR